MKILILLVFSMVLLDFVVAEESHDISLEVYLDSEINLGIKQEKLFKINNLDKDKGKVYNISVYYNITKDDLLVKEDFFIKDEVNYYSTTQTGLFFANETGNFEICGMIINSSVNDNNKENDKACKNFTVIDTSFEFCNIILNITTDKEIYLEGETVKFSNNLNNEDFPYVIEYWIEDFFFGIYKDKYNTTNTNQKSWKTNIEEKDKVLFVKAVVYPNCDDYNLTDNYAEKMFIVKSNESEEEEKEDEKNENSSLEIVEVDDNVKFGDIVDVKIKVYKGNTNKYSISLWVENDEKVSETTKIHLYDKYSSYNGQFPVKLDDNCDNKLDDGEYDVVLSGLGKEVRAEISIEGIKTSLCQKQTSTSSKSKKFEYELIEHPYFVKVGEEFIVRVKVENNDNIDYEIKAWSYVYSGSKSYSGDRELNKEEFILETGKTKFIELKNVVLEAKAGQYNLKVKINKNNQKTDYEITKPITIEVLSLKNESVEKTKIIEEDKKIEQEFRPEIIYENSTYKVKKLIGYFIIGVLTMLSVVLILRR